MEPRNPMNQQDSEADQQRFAPDGVEMNSPAGSLSEDQRLRRRETKVFLSTTCEDDVKAGADALAGDVAKIRRRGRRTARSSVLLVHSNSATLVALSDMLQRAGYRVRRAPSFEEARLALAARPACLIAGVQLGIFNGLHLVLDGRSRDPHLAAVVVDVRRDNALRVDAQRLGAAYIVEPLEEGAFLSLVSQLIDGALPGGTMELYRDRRHADRRVVVLQFEPERRRAERRRAALARGAGETL
jgi:PleD family two-component response regulator